MDHNLLEAEMGHSSEAVLAVGDCWMELPAVEIEGLSRKGRLELEKHTTYLSPRDFASSQYVEVGAVFAAPAAGVGTGYMSHFVVLMQESQGWLPKTSYHIACIGFEKRHRSIAAGHKFLVGFCQYKSSQLYQHHLQCWMILMGTLSTQASVEGGCSHQWYVDCMYSKDVLRACGHSSVRL
jgi:hypothetical protein